MWLSESIRSDSSREQSASGEASARGGFPPTFHWDSAAKRGKGGQNVKRDHCKLQGKGLHGKAHTEFANRNMCSMLVMPLNSKERYA